MGDDFFKIYHFTVSIFIFSICSLEALEFVRIQWSGLETPVIDLLCVQLCSSNTPHFADTVSTIYRRSGCCQRAAHMQVECDVLFWGYRWCCARHNTDSLLMHKVTMTVPRHYTVLYSLVSSSSMPISLMGNKCS